MRCVSTCILDAESTQPVLDAYAHPSAQGPRSVGDVRRNSLLAIISTFRQKQYVICAAFRGAGRPQADSDAGSGLRISSSRCRVL